MYQTMSPDNLPSSSVKKPSNFKSSKEDQNVLENGKIPSTTTSSGFEGKGVMNNKSPPKTQLQQQQEHHHQQHHHPSNFIHNQNHENPIKNPTHESSPSRSPCLSGGGGGGGSGDMLLQWGQRKRSRCSRTEGRSAMVSDKHPTTTNHIMPPPHPSSSLPSTSSNGSRNNGGGTTTRVRPNGMLYSKDAPGILPAKNRNLVDQMGASSASPSRNNGGGTTGSRPISRSTAGKRSPSCIEKNDKKSSSSGLIRKVKSEDSLGNNGDSVHQVEQEHGGQATTTGRSPVGEVAAAAAEKGNNGNCEVVECPRIYISLSRKEKEDDFYAMKGTKLPHRPKKRPKAVDRALQYCFPGLWLSDLTRARYEVRERKSAKKPKRTGLKGLESSMDSESE